ncbi:hypothetical protein Q1695_009320 [Nippostrongylus brasiliensis]|nr:hypothetical protein Q1695_009320 [Nippostrongylus brasiliensis]
MVSVSPGLLHLHTSSTSTPRRLCPLPLNERLLRPPIMVFTSGRDSTTRRDTSLLLSRVNFEAHRIATPTCELLFRPLLIWRSDNKGQTKDVGNERKLNA